MNGKTYSKEVVVDLISQGYTVISNGVPRKLEIDLWDYIKALEDGQCVLVLEDLLSWTDRQLSLIGMEAA